MAQRSYESYPAFADALATQQRALDELAALLERQSRMVAGLTIALGSLADFIGDEDLREELEEHLRIALEQNAPDVAETIANIIFPDSAPPRNS
ncbi:MAG TPA: hypothetical protein VKQ29_09880 [Aliidongia sp.]|nr:hypothetical protein [Aliidongia sp.]